MNSSSRQPPRQLLPGNSPDSLPDNIPDNSPDNLPHNLPGQLPKCAQNCIPNRWILGLWKSKKRNELVILESKMSSTSRC